MSVKVDYEKYNDCVSWNFLRSMMRTMGFESKGFGWMEGFFFSSSMSIITNESETKYFFVSRGLR